jgi:hypothetical protein
MPAMPEFKRPEMPERPQMAQMDAGNCFGPGARPVAFQAPQAVDYKAKAAEARAAMEAKNAEQKAAMQTRMEEMKASMQARRADMKGNCKQM